MTNKITKKEKKMFWAGISMGISGGIIGSLFANIVMELLSKQNESNTYLWILFAITFIILIIFLNFINKSINNLVKK
jgi:uncharacterized membrane protein YeaQ/YmgE (transglycosylase-associated protein family)